MVRPANLSCKVSRAVKKRMGTRTPSAAEAPRDFEPVEVGQHHIEDDEVGRIVLGLGQRTALPVVASSTVKPS